MDVKDKTICWELLATLDPEDVSRFSISPSDGQESLDLPGDHEVLNSLHVDLVCDLSLPELEGQVPHAHQSKVD